MKEGKQEGRLTAREAYKSAKWHLHHYRELKERLAKARAELEEDAYAAQCGRHMGGTPVKGSLRQSPTEREGIRLAAAAPGEPDAVAELWVKAIEDVWRTLLREDRYKAEFMERAFALTGGRQGAKSKGYQRDVVMNAMEIDSAGTFYRWKTEIVNEVIYAALDLSLLRREEG